ncbi:uncharacterized protein EKO05_0007929 [Ascochyta rabiei]|uniref:Uncharacterized protein n=1 Tax=Didymella rabiei TaxID=5454 RepID=A0A162ZNC9_DIDRA|nr:uncharacterized protein EKO05_0007929 [Ascochyta rabiei]KZM20717.1 hypothetical protein ST47_g8136 [Ascochyta rabiei]UPX17585.1 hypothetical protein EKO05_0007929 [Ascochyta rabiei]
MFSRIATRAPRAFVRYNSSSSTSSTARIINMAGQVEKPSVLEASVPVMWAICGALTYTAWNRMEGRKGDEVERLIIV